MAEAILMNKRNSDTVDDLSENDLHTEDGYPSPKLITEAYKVWDEYFGKIEIVSCSPSISDLVNEMVAKNPGLDRITNPKN